MMLVCRMYLGIVLIGAAHGLILLPVLLSYCGPKAGVSIHQYLSFFKTISKRPTAQIRLA
jgi:hypothetical protein